MQGIHFGRRKYSLSVFHDNIVTPLPEGAGFNRPALMIHTEEGITEWNT